MIKLVNHHLTATRELTYQDFRTIATLANQKPFLLKLRKPKVPNAAAHFATRSGSLTTFNNTGTETENTYRKGDALITRLTPTGIARGINGEPNTYIVKKKDFPILFNFFKHHNNQEIIEDGISYGRTCYGKNIVIALAFKNGLKIMCSWGPQKIENQTGYLFYSLVTHTVYGCDEGGLGAYMPYEPREGEEEIPLPPKVKPE